ncbi:MAG: polysaccharide pyruvyl transferase family protein [Planctomycetes bacterium]|nr:polysaccharide pyruvyl transferase family protein [Planctomycetota bacterium]
MKTVTVTHQNAINYGAVLQAYALQQQLRKLGVDDELLDLKRYDRLYFREFKFNKYLPSYIYNNIINLSYVHKTRKRIVRFRDFVEKNIKTTRSYRTSEEIIDDPPVADAYITGSDQTFNTRLGIKPERFLRFGSEGTRRISYASSMGIPLVEEKYQDEFISAIKAYSFLSTREKSAAEYISKLCSVPCSTHLDPSLLLTKDEWSRLTSRSTLHKRAMPGKYILVYVLLYNPLLNDAVKKLKSQTGLDVIVINPNSRCSVKGDVIIRDAGPLEFLNLYKNAEYVLTTSFHGTCFSLIFEKKFFSFIRKTGETRINNFLSMLNLSDRIISDVSRINLDEISYDHVNAILQSERARTIEYLTKALGL